MPVIERVLAPLLLVVVGLSSSCVASREVPKGRTIVGVLTYPSGAVATSLYGESLVTPAEFDVPAGTEVTFVVELDGYQVEHVRSFPRSTHGFSTMTPNPVNVDLTRSGDRRVTLPRASRFVSRSEVTCYWPMEVLDDCSDVSGPSRRAEVRGFRVRIAGSKDGHAVVVLPDEPPTLPQLADPIRPARDACTRVYRASLEAGAELSELVEIEHEKVILFRLHKFVLGCYMRFTTPVYSTLKATSSSRAED